MKRTRIATNTMAALAVVLCLSGYGKAAQQRPPPQPLEGSTPQDFVGEWRDDQDRFWFTVDEMVGNEVRAASFHAAHLKEGRVEGAVLTLTSESCVPIIGCYVYTHVATLIAPGQVDMTGHSEKCRFWPECRDGPDQVRFVLTRR